MRRSVCNRLLALTIAILLLSTHAQAQEEITAKEVDAYLRTVEQDATEIVRSRQLERIATWIQDNIADGAVFQTSINISASNKRKGFADLSLEKQDLLRIGGVFAGSFQKQEIEDYSLEATALEVVSQGPGVATAKIRWVERMRSKVAGPTDGSEKASKSAEITLESATDCNHLLRRMEGRLIIGLSTCTADLKF